MEIIHVAAECYPMAKAGGLGDVVGALPKYQNQLGHVAKVVMPMYRTKFLYDNQWELVHEGNQHLGQHFFRYSVIKEKTNKLGFDLYLVDINGLLDRENIYGYDDDTERFLSFQIAVCDWLNKWEHTPDVIHCHDHHTGLIPFMIKNCFEFREKLAGIPTVFTVHNAQYQGWIGWDKYYYLPAFDSWKWGLLDWDKAINPMASAVKCAWKVTTVSNSYLTELKGAANGLENLFNYEQGKSYGILNGIDSQVWDPLTDSMIAKNYDKELVEKGKRKNKKELAGQFGLDPDKPLISFVGRLVGEKAADLLPEAISQSIYQHHGNANFLVLGSGDPELEERLNQMKKQFGGFFNSYIGYSESLSHQIYAGSDFLLMPSRVEPCGLNQMYALRYGTVPMVRNIGGLKDTVTDMGDPQGFGIRFDKASVWDITYSVGRAIDLYTNKPDLYSWMRKYMMTIDHSWDSSAQQYIDLYKSLK
ncbi:MAG: glycogen synthase [Chitinophagaceae bacterium]|nr:glycogen synthase [Chitinophagaceae bacterium]MBL0273211.1 glycogen synthase [Chitinophagaceae bacterium]